MPSVEIRVDDAEVRQAFARLIQAGKNPRPALKSIGEYMLRETERRFDTQSDPEGRPWAPLSPAYARRKKGTKILTESGRLRGSIVYQVDDQGVTIGTNVVYAAVHQFGFQASRLARTQTLYFKVNKKGEVGRQFVRKEQSNFAQDVQVGPSKVNIPARPFLGLNQENRAEISRIIFDHLRGS